MPQANDTPKTAPRNRTQLFSHDGSKDFCGPCFSGLPSLRNGRVGPQDRLNPRSEVHRPRRPNTPEGQCCRRFCVLNGAPPRQDGWLPTSFWPEETPAKPPGGPQEAPKLPRREAPQSPLKRPQAESMRTLTHNPGTVAGWAQGHLIAGIRAASRLSMLRSTSTNSQGAAGHAPPASSISSIWVEWAPPR